MRSATSLGLQFLVRGDRRAWARVVLTAGGVMVGVWCLLVALALPSVLNARQSRAAARTPVGATSPMTAQGKIGIVEDRYGSRTIRTVFIRPESALAPLPPGLEEYPEPGRAIVSPALQDALRSDNRVRAFFPFEVSGTIERHGLIGPDELFGYVGGGDTAPYAGSFSSFGTQFAEPVDVRPGDLSLVQRALIGLVGVPLAAYFTVTARLSAASRDRRLAALRLVGMPARDAKRLSTVEPVVASLAGTALGAVLHAASNGWLADSGISGLRWFFDDSELTLPRLIGALIMIPVFAALMGIFGSRHAVRGALAARRQGGISAPPRPWRLVPLGIAATLLGSLMITGIGGPAGIQFGALQVFLLMGGILLGGFGLVTGFAPLIARTSRWMGRRTDRPWLALAFRRLDFDPSAPARVVVGIVLVLFLMGFANGLQRDSIAATGSLGDVERYTLDAYQVSKGARPLIGRMRDVTAYAVVAGTAVEPRKGVPSQQNLPLLIMFASCADARHLADTHLNCEEGKGYRISSESSRLRHPEIQPGAQLRIPRDRTPNPGYAIVTAPSAVLEAKESSLIGLRVDVLMPLDALPSGQVPDTAQFWLGSSKDAAAIESITGQVAAIAPDATLQFPEDDYKTRRHVEIYRSMLRAGLFLGVVVAVAAFVVASIDRAVERRANVTALAIVGVPVRSLRAAQALQVAYPLALGGVVATIMGFLLEHATVFGGGLDRTLVWRTPLISLAVTAAGALMAGAVSSLAVPRKIDPTLIRRE